jgi:alkylhydroperoxidase family enzyme
VAVYRSLCDNCENPAVGEHAFMTWIKTIPLSEADEKLRQAIEGEKSFYPREYADPVHPDASGASSIVGSHTLIPQALYHAFSTFGALMAPDLPLERRQHEMIATVVSVTNRCQY